MKRLALTLAIILTMTLGATAQNGGGLMGRGSLQSEYADWDASWSSGQDLLNRTSTNTFLIGFVNGHNLDNNQDAPLGSGIALLLGLGGAYLVAKKRKKE